MATKKSVVGWVEQLYASVGKAFVHLETTDGAVRSGSLTAIESRIIEINGKRKRFPVELQLNGDKLDLVGFGTLKKIEIE